MRLTVQLIRHPRGETELTVAAGLLEAAEAAGVGGATRLEARMQLTAQFILHQKRETKLMVEVLEEILEVIVVRVYLKISGLRSEV
jgi:hypothetical protein